ncbi:hypothetical protein [Parvularcula oceani]|nr:hypothetical protein [Parvularcula oceani]
MMAKRSVFDTPEVPVALFGFLLNFVWEFWQVPLYGDIPDAPHWEAVKTCTIATFGDVGIVLVAFWCAAVAGRSRHWIASPATKTIATFLIVGVGITLIAEYLATEVWDRWSYGELMPILPGLGIGVSPVLQWLLVPLALIPLSRRMLCAASPT